MKKRIQLCETKCRRCNRPLVTLNRGLYGCDELKARLDRICTDCITVDEAQEILDGQAKAILG